MSELTPLESAARAIEMADSSDWHEKQNKDYEYIARAGLTAVREPSKAMIDAGFVARDMERSPIAIWQAMLDAALNQPGE